jgi:uncharacterized membrane protein YjjB (DUF3815 family)
MMAFLELLLEDAFWSAWAAVGFAILFNAPRRALLPCALCGALGHATRTLMMEQADFTIVSASFLGAIVVGFCGGYFAVRWKSPVSIFTIPGVIPMVPGVFAYRAMLGILDLISANNITAQSLITNATLNMVRVTLILVALAAGIITPQLLFQREKPVV